MLHTSYTLPGAPDGHVSGMLSKARALSIKSGCTLFRHGDTADGCYWLERGALKLTVPSQTGHQRIIAFVGAGSIIGELEMIGSSPRLATASAIVDCQLLFLSRSAFNDFLHEHPELNEMLMATLVARLRESVEEAASEPFLTVKVRVARALLRIAAVLGQDAGDDFVAVNENVRQDDLAAMAGVARENVSRTLSDWRRRKVIVSSRGGKLILDRARLRHESSIGAPVSR